MSPTPPSRKCVTEGCAKASLAVTHPDIVDPYGNKVRLGNCVDHELELLRKRIHAASFYESQITAMTEEAS